MSLIISADAELINFRSACDIPMLKKFYRSPGLTRWTILEKEVVDEVIFRTIAIGGEGNPGL